MIFVNQSSFSGNPVSEKSRNILFVIVDNFKTERLGIQLLSTISREEGFEPCLLILTNLRS